LGRGPRMSIVAQAKDADRCGSEYPVYPSKREERYPVHLRHSGNRAFPNRMTGRDSASRDLANVSSVTRSEIFLTITPRANRIDGYPEPDFAVCPGGSIAGLLLNNAAGRCGGSAVSPDAELDQANQRRDHEHRDDSDQQALDQRHAAVSRSVVASGLCYSTSPMTKRTRFSIC